MSIVINAVQPLTLSKDDFVKYLGRKSNPPYPVNPPKFKIGDVVQAADNTFDKTPYCVIGIKAICVATPWWTYHLLTKDELKTPVEVDKTENELVIYPE